MKDVIIIGAGIAGLSAGFELYKNNIDFHILEETQRVGNVIESLKINDCLIETGPQTFSSSNKNLLELVNDLGIEDKLIEANRNSTTRYIYINGGLQPVPHSFLGFFKSKLLSREAKITLIEELFIKKKEEDESIEDFISRRFGREVLKNIIQPYISGIYAGDVKKLSAGAVFPKLKELEYRYNSILLGVFLSRNFKHSLKNLTLYSFKEGMETISNELHEKLKTKVTLSIKNIEITRAKDFFIVTFKANNKTINYTTNSILFAIPAYKIPDFSYVLPDAYKLDSFNIEYIPIATISQLIDKNKIKHDLNGFGFLCTKEPHRKLLGTIWTSSIFPARAPLDKALLTSYIGGAYYKKIADLPEEEIITIASKEISEIFQISDHNSIQTLHLKVHHKAIPQYNLGHLERLRAIEEIMDKSYGLFFTGNYLYGISIGDVVTTSKRAVERIKKFLMMQKSASVAQKTEILSAT